jgi:hypothetical protein
MNDRSVFVVYPSTPKQLGQTLENITGRLPGLDNINIESWEQLDIPGRFIVDGVLKKIDSADFVIADITRLNFNVTFEIGYSIGKGKRVIFILNSALNPARKDIESLGIYDTIGYKEYENSGELQSYIYSIEDTTPLHFPPYNLDKSTPIFVLDTLHKTDSSIRIISKIKKSGIKYRSYDPRELPRLSTIEAYHNVKKSIAVVIHLLSQSSTDHYYNNLRGAFLAGLAYGLNKLVLILQEGYDPVPIDYRDFVYAYKNRSDIDKYISMLAPKVIDELQSIDIVSISQDRNPLEQIDLGSPAAENEMTRLENYYVNTDEYKQVLSGSARLAVGRKGSGKTALFFQARDYLRNDKRRIVIDLKPDGHQLKRFKDLVLNGMAESVQEHLATAFWEYALFLEICYKVLEKDQEIRPWNPLYERYQALADLYKHDPLIGDSDFSERILILINRISLDFDLHIQNNEDKYLRAPQVTELIYKHDMAELREHLSEYIKTKNGVFILFDNIDKGWPTRGIDHVDIIILRSLLEAARKIERFFHSRSIPVQSTVFIRNDVFELLVDESPDRGKELKVSLDWTDTDLLKEFLRKRLIYNNISVNSSFEDAWHMICTSHINGEKTADFIIQRSLMRPRNLLSLVNYCKGNAVNLQHNKITDSDIEKAWSTYSYDIVNEISLEIRDIFPQAEDILYNFIGATNYLTLNEIYDLLSESSISAEYYERVIEILVWFAFLGVADPSDSESRETYIYNVFYDIKKLRWMSKAFKPESMVFSIHKAFWPFLEINVIEQSKILSRPSRRTRRMHIKKDSSDQIDLNFNNQE